MKPKKPELRCDLCNKKGATMQNYGDGPKPLCPSCIREIERDCSDPADRIEMAYHDLSYWDKRNPKKMQKFYEKYGLR